MNRINICKLSVTGLLSVAMAAASLVAPITAEAKPTRTSVNNNANSNRSANVNSNRNTNVNSNRNANVNSNKNVNVNSNRNVNANRNVNVDVDVDRNHHHPVGTAVAVGATMAVTAAVIGSMTTTLPPACTVVLVNGLSYQQCGSTWYQPQYVGSSVQYVVVAPMY
jgi:hypothetical protein